MQSKVKNQNFVLFWLGLLTGALLILALNMPSSADEEAAKLRRTAPSYSAPVQYTNPVPDMLRPEDIQNAVIKKSGSFMPLGYTTPVPEL